MTLIKFLSLVSLLAVVEALNVEDIVYAGEACYNKGSALVFAGEPCLMYRTIDIPVDWRFPYSVFYCNEGPFDEIIVETWTESDREKAHVPPTSIAKYMAPQLNETTIGRSDEYYVFEDFGVVQSSDIPNEIWNITWKEKVMFRGKEIFSNEHRCLIKGVSTGHNLTSGLYVLALPIIMYHLITRTIF